MSGVAVIRYLLANNASVTAIVPADRILAGDAPLKTTRPTISVRQISAVPTFLTVGQNDPKSMYTERVQVSPIIAGAEGTPEGGGYPAVKEILKRVLSACKNTKGTINGVDVDSILPDLEGPDLSDRSISLYTQSMDFLVKFNA